MKDTTISATPDFFLLETCWENLSTITRTPIIAWSIDEYGETRPITMHGMKNFEQPPGISWEPWAIQCPDGRVIEIAAPDVGDLEDGGALQGSAQDFQSVAEWLTELTEFKNEVDAHNAKHRRKNEKTATKAKKVKSRSARSSAR